MGGVAHAEQGEVGGVDGVRDRLLGERSEEVFGDLAGGGADGDVAEDLGGEAAAEVLGGGVDADGEGGGRGIPGRSGRNTGVSPLRLRLRPRGRTGCRR